MSERFLTVMGKGSISVKPDLIVMSMKLTTATSEYANTMERAASEAEALKNALISIGYNEKALKTTDFHVSMEYNRIKDAKGNWIQKFEGYKCTHSLKLEFDLDMKRLGETLTAIAACGTAPVFQIVFSVKDKNAVSAQLLENAVSNAKEKAAVLARAAGVQLGVIQRIEYSWGKLRLCSETRFNDAMHCAAATAAIEMEPEDIKIDDTVTVVWAIE